MVPKPFPFEHAKNDHAGSCLAVVALNHLLVTDEAPRIVRGIDEFLIALQLGQKDASLVAGAACST